VLQHSGMPARDNLGVSNPRNRLAHVLDVFTSEP
jgi:hypothetical protein